MKMWLQNSFIRFLLVGLGNTLLSAVLMLVLYNGLGVHPVLSSGIAYVAGAIMSFFVNRSYTFSSQERFWRSAIKFAINVAVLWAITTPLLQPWAVAQLTDLVGVRMANNLSLIGCMGIYTVLNYLGQRFFAFRKSR